MDKQHVNILICTPGRSMEAEYVKSLVATLTYLSNAKISYLYLNEYSSQVSAAREATIMGSRFLDIYQNSPVHGQITYDKIIWIDSDISWEVEDFIKLYESEYDILSGIYFNEEGVPMFSTDENQIYYNKEILENNDKPFEVFGVGFGFVSMKNGIFENLKRPWFETIFQKIKNDDEIEVYIPWGEDYSWCKKAKDAGYKVWIDPSISLGHHKKVKIKI